jgi:hypothetical protein
MAAAATLNCNAVTFRLHQAALAIGLAFVCLSFAATVSLADGGQESSASSSTPRAGFNWFANAGGLAKDKALALALTRKVALQSTYGSGSWVCSPAGFGSNSKCFRR